LLSEQVENPCDRAVDDGDDQRRDPGRHGSVEGENQKGSERAERE
jgi:hypothetical protein